MLQSVKMSNCLRNSTSNLLRILTAHGMSSMSRSSVAVECLKQRGILKVSGKESSVFLQGLITNDMRHLEEGSVSMYTLFLNTKGRVMYDAIIYRTNEMDAYFVECDTVALSALQRHLKLFRVRKKIGIDIENEFKIWVTFNPNVADIMHESSVSGIKESISHLSSNILESEEYTNNDSRLKHLLSRENFIICRDPRLAALGARIVAPASEDLSSLETLPPQYRLFRYKLGIGEGVDELPPGKCFPLEVNGDYLHGVSFHKGCYVGQELTARTHHTGVIRKRHMPLFFDIVPASGFVQDTPILGANSCNKSPVGKLIGGEQNVGLGLLRIVEALNNPILNVLDGTGQTMRPLWWPQEAPKERVSKDEAN